MSSCGFTGQFKTTVFDSEEPTCCCHLHTHNRQISIPPVGFEPTISTGERLVATHRLRSWVRIPPWAWIFVCCECRVLSGRGLCDELITRPEESYRLWCVVVWDLETSRMGAPYIYDISHLRVKHVQYMYFHENQRLWGGLSYIQANTVTWNRLQTSS